MKMNNYSLKNLLIWFMLGFLSIALLIGVLSLFGVIPVYFNGKEYFGIFGFLISIGIALFCSLIISLACYVILNLGRFIYIRVFVPSNNNWRKEVIIRSSLKFQAGKDNNPSPSIKLIFISGYIGFIFNDVGTPYIFLLSSNSLLFNGPRKRFCLCTINQ